MNFVFLKYFYDTVKFNSVTLAASSNYVSQSAISQGITQLERILCVKLLTHKRNSIKVTEEGEIVFKQSRAIFREIENLKIILKTNKEEYKGLLSFACSHSLALSVLPDLLTKLKDQAPLIIPRVVFGHTGLIKNWIKQGEIEFGFVLDNDDLSSLSLYKIYEGAFRFFESNQRTKNEPVTSCIFPPARAEIHLVKKLFLKEFGFEINTEMEISSWEVIAELIKLNPSVGFMPDYVGWGDEKIYLSSLNLNIPYTLHAAYPLNEDLSRNAQLFLSISQEFFKNKKSYH